MERHPLSDIAWDVPESVYRQDPALSQSTLSKYEREGFEHLDTLFEHTESPSLTFGSCVDCLMTDGEEAFRERFFVCDIPSMKPSVEPVVKKIYEQFHNAYTNISDILDSDIMPIIAEYNYQPNWKNETRCKSVKQEGQHYYQTMFMAGDRTIVTQDVYNRVFACVRALKDSPQTKVYFQENNPFSDIERYYQLKFRHTFKGVDYRGMLDLILIDHKHKVIVPCDLKTSSGREYSFPSHFIKWGYDSQARLYWRLLRAAMNEDEYYKDFTLANFRFIVVNNIDNPIPLVWEYNNSKTIGDVCLGKYTLRDPEKIGIELNTYLKEKPAVPLNINLRQPNSIEAWFDGTSDNSGIQ